MVRTHEPYQQWAVSRVLLLTSDNVEMKVDVFIGCLLSACIYMLGIFQLIPRISSLSLPGLFLCFLPWRRGAQGTWVTGTCPSSELPVGGCSAGGHHQLCFREIKGGRGHLPALWALNWDTGPLKNPCASVLSHSGTHCV